MPTGESNYTNLQVKKWRAITYDWNILSSYGNQSNLYCLTDFQVAWLLSNTELMRWSTRWKDCPCTQDDLDAMTADMEYNLMNCFDTRWMGQLQYVYDQLQDNKLEEYQLEYDADGIPGINPDAPTDFYNGDDSLNRQKALCMACDIYIRSYLNQFLDAASQEVTGLILIGIAVALVPGFGLIAGVIAAGLAYLTQQYVDACNDSEAINEIVCCMFNGLYDQAVSQANFEDSLSGCTYDPSTNEYRLQQLISSDMNQIKNWFSFIDALGKAWDLLEKGIEYTCDCVPEPTWSHTFDFEDSDGGWILNTTNVTGGTNGAWFDGLGWICTPTAFAGSGLWRNTVNIEKSFDARTITRIVVNYDLDKGIYSPNGTAIAIVEDEVIIKSDIGSALVTADNQDYDTGVISRVSSKIRIYLASSIRTSAIYNGTGEFNSITIHGLGTDPF